MPDKKVDKVMAYFKLEGVKDIYPLKARGAFAKALMLEDGAGHTTPQAQAKLDEAVALVTVGEVNDRGVSGITTHLDK